LIRARSRGRELRQGDTGCAIVRIRKFGAINWWVIEVRVEINQGARRIEARAVEDIEELNVVFQPESLTQLEVLDKAKIDKTGLLGFTPVVP
jgi:hypothetical protein